MEWPDLKHHEKKKPVSPHFLRTLQDITVEEGKETTVTFEAEFYQKRPRKIRWTRVSSPITLPTIEYLDILT